MRQPLELSESMDGHSELCDLLRWGSPLYTRLQCITNTKSYPLLYMYSMHMCEPWPLTTSLQTVYTNTVSRFRYKPTDLQYLVLVGSETESLQNWFPHDGGPANLPYDQQLVRLYRGLAVSREVGLCRTHYPRGPLGGCQVRHCLEGVAFKCCLEVVAVGRKDFSSLLSVHVHKFKLKILLLGSIILPLALQLFGSILRNTQSLILLAAFMHQ